MWYISGGPWKYSPIPCPANAGIMLKPKFLARCSINDPICQKLAPGLHTFVIASCTHDSVALTKFLPISSTLPISNVLEQSPWYPLR